MSARNLNPSGADMTFETTRYSGVLALLPTVVVQRVDADGKKRCNIMLLWLAYGLSFGFAV